MEFHWALVFFCFFFFLAFNVFVNLNQQESILRLFYQMKKKAPMLLSWAQEEGKQEKEKSYIPLLLPVDSNLSFKMARTKGQQRLAN